MYSERPPWLPDFSSLAALQSLLMGRYLTDGLQGGVHQGNRHGSSAEFAEYRDYVPGDDLRRLDWKRLARTDHLHIKLFDEETSQWILLVIDSTASMRYRYAETLPTKWDMARATAATLASLFLMRGDGVGAIRVDSPKKANAKALYKNIPVMAAEYHELAISDTPTQWENLVHFLDVDYFGDTHAQPACSIPRGDSSIAVDRPWWYQWWSGRKKSEKSPLASHFSDRKTTDPPPFRQDAAVRPAHKQPYEHPLSTVLTERVLDNRRRTNVFVISDFFEDLPTLWNAVEALRIARHEVTLIHILDPAEISFPFTAPGGWRDPENNRVVWGSPDTIRSSYQRRFTMFLEQMRLFSAERKIRYRQFFTDRPLVDLLVEMLLKY
ncbi:MAG: DUF58 domain-containing protein [Thermoguttaceae bacterium]|nr:DUF58 domain-containing protein [Thermoguttaceae bacterium]